MDTVDSAKKYNNVRPRSSRSQSPAFFYSLLESLKNGGPEAFFGAATFYFLEEEAHHISTRRKWPFKEVAEESV